ncbi:TPA: DUF1983 domain-containing protein [Klebsiella michiganensis]|nr:DUF1983 domain-containing protein [Klebsiella michiganensis]HCB1848948.1 DUF1983 domain-containing protein [Klebsiella oxytoca]
MDIISMTQHLIKGRKGGSSSPRTPTEQPDDLQSVAKAKILMALGEGEFAGALTAKDIYLDGTPLENSDGSQNFSGVVWEFRSGTQAQNYIQGIPGSENEINVGTEISSKTAWTHSFSNTQLSAVRLRLKWPSLFKQEDNGDLMGNSVSNRWTVSGAATFTTASAPHSGSRIVRCGEGKAAISQRINVKADRTYRIGVFTRRNEAAVTADQSYHKLRIGDTSGSILSAVNFITPDLLTGSTWTDISGSWKASSDMIVEAAIWSSLSAGEIYFDDFYVVDITDESSIAANAGAISNLTSRVSNAEGTLTSQSSSITSLQNGLSTANQNITKKADASAVTSLSNRVTEAEGKLTSQGNSITQLQASLISGSLIANGGMESDLSLWVDSGTGSAFAYDSGEKALRTTTGSIRVANQTRIPVEPDTKLTVTFEFKSSEAMSNITSDTMGVISELNNPTDWLASTTAWLNGVTTAWQTKSVELTIPANFTNNFVCLRFAAGGWAPAASARLYIRRVVVFSSNGVAGKADASVVNDLSSKVTQQGNTLTSQSSAITKLQNDLSTTNSNVNKKADQSALTSLTGRVENTESGLTAANSNITGLTSAIRAVGAAGDDYIPNPTFDAAYDRMGLAVVESTTSGVPANCPHAYVAKLASRDHIPKMNNIPATVGDVIELSALVACGAGTAAFNLYVCSAESPAGGIAAANSGGSVSATAGKAWVRTTWRWTVTAAVAAKGYFRPFLQINQSSPFGTIWYATDWHCRNITAAAKAQSTADATASAVDSLTTKVTQQGDTLSSIGNRTTTLENGLKTTNTNVSNKADASAVQILQNTVTQQGKDITAANSAITKLTSDLSTTNASVNKKADATALQTLQNTVTEQGKTLTSQGSSLTELNNALSDTTTSLVADGKIPGNLISNGSFERGQDAFTGWSSITSVISAQSPNYGGKILMCSTGLAGISQQVPVVKGNTYKIGVFARAQGGSVMNDQGNNKLRIGQASLLYDRQFNTANLPTNASWIELTGTWKATVDGMVNVSVNSSLKSGAQYFDDFYFVDITGEVDIAANAGAISGLTTRVTSAEGTLTSQGSSITSLQNGLTTANTNISKKADSSTVTSLTNRVTQAENKLESQGSSVTSLNSSIVATQQDADAAKAMPTNMLTNNSFERGFDSWSNSGWSTLAAQNPKSGKYIIQAATSSNPTVCDQAVNLTGGRTYRVGAWVRKSGDFAIRDANNTKISLRNSSGPLKDIPLTASIGTAWTLMSADYKPSANAALTISLRTALSAGYLYVDDAFCIDVSDEVANTANSSALTALNTQVKIDGENIKANTQELKNLKVDLGDKAKASVVNDLKTEVKKINDNLDVKTEDLKILTASVGDLEGMVKTQGETVANSEGKINSMYSIKVETLNNGQKVGAGLVLGSNGSTSDMILYADRFSLFNRNSKTAVPVMIAEGNELYIDSARIKNGTIDIGKVTERLSSINYVTGKSGWSITKNGGSEFNNVIVRGEIQADTGTLNNVVINESCNILGTVRANKIVGDVGSWAINISQHRSRRFPKAQWIWFDLLAVDRQPFEQRVQLLGALRQDDSVNISGGGSLTAGMEYKNYGNGSLSMGKLGYCILMLGTGDTSGGGPMTCALSIDGVLYKQEDGSMEIQSMDFIVPAGTGETVVRYGYYLDRNGGMTGVILSRFHAFVMRNSNIIRGISSD